MIRAIQWAVFWGLAMSGGGRWWRRASAVLAALLGACASAPTESTASPMPAHVVAMARAAWLAAGHVAPACAAPSITAVDFATFAAECGAPSCADPTVTRDTPRCAHACTWIDLDPAASTVWWVGPATAESGREVESDARVWVHEIFHAWRDCTYGEPDHVHQHAETWVTAMEHVQ